LGRIPSNVSFFIYCLSTKQFSIAFATNFITVLITRLTLTISQAFLVPIAYSLIIYFFPVSQRARAFGIFFSFMYIGVGSSSMLLLLAEEFGWRDVSMWSGIVCFSIPLIVFFFVRADAPKHLLEDERLNSSEEHEAPPSLWESIRLMFVDNERRQVVWWLSLAMGMRLIVNLTLGAFFIKWFRFFSVDVFWCCCEKGLWKCFQMKYGRFRS
jgi:MFS family permease